MPSINTRGSSVSITACWRAPLRDFPVRGGLTKGPNTRSKTDDIKRMPNSSSTVCHFRPLAKEAAESLEVNLSRQGHPHTHSALVSQRGTACVRNALAYIPRQSNGVKIKVVRFH